MNNNLDILDSQDISLKKQLEKDAAAFREEKFRPEPEQYTELLDTRIQIRPDFRDKLIEQLKGTFGKYYDYHRRDIAANEVDYLNVEDPDVFSHRAWELEYQRKQEIRQNQPVRTKERAHGMELLITLNNYNLAKHFPQNKAFSKVCISFQNGVWIHQFHTPSFNQ